MNREEYDSIVEECRKLSVTKNKSYGDASLISFGDMGCFIRASDKMERIKTLLLFEAKEKIMFGHKSNIETEESLDDNLIDTINYLIYTLMIRRGKL